MEIVGVLGTDKTVEQICYLINKYNGWARQFTPHNLRATNTIYVVSLFEDTVIGVGGLKKLNDTQTEFMHLCVRPEFRRLGIASRISKRRLELLDTPVAISHIRSDNMPSIKNSLKSGFVLISSTPKRDCSILTFARFKSDELNRLLKCVSGEILNGILRTECHTKR